MLNGQAVCTEHSLNATAPLYNPLVNRDLTKCEGRAHLIGGEKHMKIVEFQSYFKKLNFFLS